MEHDAVLSATDVARPTRQASKSSSSPLAAVCVVAALGALLGAAWMAARGALYTSGSTFGYSLGVAGGTMMLILLLYPVRKHLPLLRNLGPLRHWFRIHMVCGILGPLAILFHSTFRVGSLNAGVAVACMVLVATSGIVGRFIYRRIHHGLYGSRATLEELQAALTRQLAALSPVLERAPQLRVELERFVALAQHVPQGRWPRAFHFLSLEWNRVSTGWKVSRAINATRTLSGGQHRAHKAEVAALVGTIDAALRALQRHAQFATYERLFALWHVVHIPFVYMLVISAIVHVVAVHMY